MSKSESNSETGNGGAMQVCARAGARGVGPWNEEFGDSGDPEHAKFRHAETPKGAADLMG